MTTENGTAQNNQNMDGGVKDSLIIGHTSLGTEIQATLLRLTPHIAVFEIYTSVPAIRASEVFTELKIVVRNRTIYKGRAVVRSLLDVGSRFVCEVELEKTAWVPAEISAKSFTGDKLVGEFNSFLQEWQNTYRVVPEFKVVIADMQTYLTELQLWLDQTEMNIRASIPAGTAIENSLVNQLAEPVIRSIDVFIDQFEAIATRLDAELHPVHRAYLRRHLHSLLLSAPFADRAFRKPLGYAGDYEMVDMMLRTPDDAGSLFTKIINVWLLGQAPAQAHRNRVSYLHEKLITEGMRAQSKGKGMRVYNLGCGPAVEVQQFIQNCDFAKLAHFTLVDFNEETLRYLKGRLIEIQKKSGRGASVEIVQKSVQRVLKESLKSARRLSEEQFDFVYCAGLFDYLTQPVCKQVMNFLYDLVAPGGLLLATNVSDVMNSSRPFRYSMEYILDWHLIYRNRQSLAELAPQLAVPDDVVVIAESTGVNVFIEVRKPLHD